jgi:hypothetical protein
MPIFLGCAAFGGFEIIAAIAEGNQPSQKRLKTNKRHSLRH